MKRNRERRKEDIRRRKRERRSCSRLLVAQVGQRVTGNWKKIIEKEEDKKEKRTRRRQKKDEDSSLRSCSRLHVTKVCPSWAKRHQAVCR